ncbi:hypothetical protein [Aeoliella mucimassa]|uniref:Uncharacterized protein n=1 Tax=Aeoliella mucimassa TaxID=2527972 RepID=A0A518AM90_9BACT|nr:hypothetical protein [Aeoliella mucimassa]QDU55843.1 hypothetical protein Pan181_20400 [Aeoliella mucimassa]
MGSDPSAFAPALLAISSLASEDLQLDEEFKSKLTSEFDGDIHIEVSEDGDHQKSAKISIDGPGEHAFDELMKKLTKRSYQTGLLYQNSLISLVSSAEWFLSQLLHLFFEKYPDAAQVSDKQLPLKELQTIGSVDEARSYLIDLRIEGVLRGSFSDWTSFLKDTLKLSMGYLSDFEDNLIEACQRRHLLVHNGGIMNKIYQNKVPESVMSKVPVGMPIQILQGYLDQAIDKFERFLLLVAFELWKKIAPDDVERAGVILELSYDHLCAERWQIAENLSYFLAGDMKQPEIARLTARINYWQALKWQGKFEDKRREVEDEDFSAKEEKYTLAQAALLDDEDRFFQILPGILESNKLTYEDLNEWPLFRSMRDTDTFRNIYAAAPEVNAIDPQ